jgi:hypothetical protein
MSRSLRRFIVEFIDEFAQDPLNGPDSKLSGPDSKSANTAVNVIFEDEKED